MVNPLKVSSRSNPNSVAGALVAVIREQGYAEMQAVGAGALNQAVKAIAIARGFVAPSGSDLTCAPAFTDIMINGEGRTALKLLVEKRTRGVSHNDM
jgi:stage V sporulation protein S